MDDEKTILCASGANVTLFDSICCGMAGPFGFERDKYDISQTPARCRATPRRPFRQRNHPHHRRRLRLLRKDHPEHQCPPQRLAELLLKT